MPESYGSAQFLEGGTARRPRKSHLISLLPPFFSSSLKRPFLPYRLLCFLVLLPHLLSFLHPPLLSSFSSSFTYSLGVSSRFSRFNPRPCTRIRFTLSHGRTHSRTTHAHPLCSFSRHFGVFSFFFFLRLFRSPERTALHIYRHSSRGRVLASLSRLRTLLPYLLPSFFLLLSIFFFFFFCFFKHRQVKYRITIVCFFFFVCLFVCLLFLVEIERVRAPVHPGRYADPSERERCATNDTSDGLPARNHRTLSSYSLIIHEINARKVPR